MSDVPESAMSTDPKAAEGGDAIDNPRGGALYSWPRDPIPASRGESGVTQPRHSDMPA